MNKAIEKTTSGEVVDVEIVDQKNTDVNFNAETLISQAIKSKVPVETMERLLAMAEKMQAIRAKQEFDKAMARFQSECPTITKTKEVRTKAGTLAYRYAPIEGIVEQVKLALNNNGFSYSTNMEVLPAGVRVRVKVTHIVGHSETTEMEVPLGERTNIMSASQVTAAASTFAKRYAFCNAFGILTGDEDTDAAPAQSAASDLKDHPQAPPAPVTPKTVAPASPNQLKYIKDLMQEKHITEAELIEHGYSPLKDLTGGKEGTASELIEFLKTFLPAYDRTRGEWQNTSIDEEAKKYM